MKIVHKLKPWQAFTLIHAPLVISSIVFDSPFTWWGVIFCGFLNSWIFSVGYYANQSLSAGLQRSTTLFIVALGYATVYAVALLGLGLDAVVPMQWLFLLHLLAMAGVSYALLFSARQLTAVKEGRDVRWIEYGEKFFLMLIFPIGIWFIQPMVNTYLSDRSSNVPRRGG